MTVYPLRHWRILRAWTREDLAERAGLDPVTLWRLEHGKTRGRLTTWQAIARALGVEPAQIAEFRTVYLDRYLTDEAHRASRLAG